MNILLIKSIENQLVKELKSKAKRNGWHITELRIVPTVLNYNNLCNFYRIIDNMDYVVFCRDYLSRSEKVLADKSLKFFKTYKRVLHYNDNEAYFIKMVTNTHYNKFDNYGNITETIDGYSLDEELCRPEYEPSINEDTKNQYSKYVKLYDMEYPNSNTEWLRAIQQIDYYIKNQLEYLVSEEEQENIINYYEKIELSYNDKATLRAAELEELI